MPAEIQTCFKHIGILSPSKNMSVRCLAKRCISRDKACLFCVFSWSFFIFLFYSIPFFYFFLSFGCTTQHIRTRTRTCMPPHIFACTQTHIMLLWLCTGDCFIACEFEGCPSWTLESKTLSKTGIIVISWSC